MPWTYGQKGIDFAQKYFNLRYKLIPYIYTYCRIAFDKALPLNRPLYYEYPDLEESYSNPHEYFFGKEFLAAPIIDSTGERDIYLPPGEWYDYFSMKKFNGNQKIHQKHNLETFPLFVRAGSIIPMHPEMNYVDERPMDKLIINFYGPYNSEFNLYEDDGISLDYKNEKFANTLFTSQINKYGTQTLTINQTKGNFKGLVDKRAYDLVIYDIKEPKEVTINDTKISDKVRSKASYSYNKEKSILEIKIEPVSIRERAIVVIK
jgi:alpha-glucosidase (family GH31 glycosyl hydrolase)